MINHSLNFISLISFIIFSYINKGLAEDCLTHSLSDLNYPKALTLYNGYQLLVTSKGIYSFEPDLSNIVFHYNFTEEQKFSTDITNFKNSINQVELAQFNGENGGKKYVICLANNIIYFINETGEIIFYKELENKVEVDYSITLVAYKYNSGYYLVISYNNIDTDFNTKVQVFYYKIVNENNIQIVTSRTFQLINNLNLKCISCHAMFTSGNSKSLICFLNAINGNYNYFNAYAFDPDQNFNYVFMAKEVLIETEFSAAKVIKSCINDEQTKALVCYTLENNEVDVKCFYYNSQENTLSKIFINVNYCNTNIYGFNIFFFQQSNEYIFSCVDSSQEKFSMRRLDINFNLINDDDNNFLKRSFSDCDNYDFFSIIYISNYNVYSGIFNSNCRSGNYVRIFMLSDIFCIQQNEKDENIISTSPETTIVKTTIPIPETTIVKTTLPIPETTIIKTTLPIPETTIVKTTLPIPETTIVKTTLPNLETTIVKTTIPIPETTIVKTTLPNLETTIPLIKTTGPEVKITIVYTNEQRIIANSLKVESSMIDSTIIQNMKTTVLDIEKNKYTESIPIEEISTIYPENKKTEIIKKTDFPIESLCENNKIYSEGKCICNTEKGFYSLNYKNSEAKCYKISELPKNVYFNNITNSYEICYKNCDTCLKGGTYNENNCLTCAKNYIKEPGKNSSNCVENCKYLYYYNIFGQYYCTEDEQCPSEASLIIRTKEKCINKCSNDDTHIFQYNAQCLPSCPDNTEPNSNNICQIVNTNTCTTSEYKLNLDETINENNVKLTAKNYAIEFYYTINHITKFTSSNFTMILYKNSSCIDELKLDITKIEYNSCIHQLKKDNNIDEDKELITAIIDIKNGKSPIISFGFFHPDTGEKLNATKSCSDKNVIMYENIINLLNEPLGLKLLQEQKIDIFDLTSDFYNDICFHYESPNGKDATLQDRIKTFYPNVALCNNGCKSKGIDLIKLEVGCECTFHDLLSNEIFRNELIGDNILIKETLKELSEIISNLNLEVLTCYKDVFDFKYFKKNIGGFIIIGFFVIQTFCFIYYYGVSYDKILRYIYSLTEAYILSEKKKDKNNLLNNKISFPPKKKSLTMYVHKIHNQKKNKNNEIKSRNKTKSLSAKIKGTKILTLKKNNSIKNTSELLLNNNKSKSINDNTINLIAKKNKLKRLSKYENLIDENIDIKKFIEPIIEDMDTM